MPAQAEARTKSLTVRDFELLEIPYLNSAIRTSQAMAWFQDRVVLGTGRAPLGFMGRFTGRAGGRFGSQRADTGGRDEDGAQVLTFDPTTGKWQKIFDSPLITGRDGKPRARDRSIRAAFVCQTLADSQPCLYLGVGSLEGNVVFLRSEDGRTLQECAGSGFNLNEADIPSVRSMACLRGRLYSTPTGKNYGRGMMDDNITDHPIVFETTDPLSGNWAAASEAGFGDPHNMSINELAVFNDHLYAATNNQRYGFQLWKTDAAGDPPYRWRKIIDRGAWLGATSSLPAAVAVFEGALYVTATIQRQGRQGLDRFGPYPAEIIRVHADDHWELVTGKPRFSPDGLKRPISGLLGGLGDFYTHVFWRFAVHRGWLYVATAGWRWMPTYLRDRDDLSEAQLEHLRADTEAAKPGQFSLWRTADGVTWENITRDGFPGTNPQNYGIREMIATPHGLFVAPTAMAGAARGGGLELWWGHA